MLKPAQSTAIVAIILGCALVVSGLASKTLISETDMPATEAEKLKAKATPAKRIILVSIGLLAVLYGVYNLIH